jgi:MFS family permease
VTYPFACVPFLFLFFSDHGMNEAQYGEILTAYYVTMFLAEIPTGMLADRIGPKPMLVAGPLLLGLGFTALVVYPTYSGFLIGEILIGLGHSVLSGPPTVALYEVLKQNGQGQRYLSEESKIHANRLYGTGISFLLGGLMVYFGNHDGTAYASSIVLTCVLLALAVIIALRLSLGSHNRHVHSGQEDHKSLLSLAAYEMQCRPVRWLLIYWVMLFTLLRFPFHNYQPYLKAASSIEPLLANAVVIGFVFAVLNLIAAPVSAKVPAMVARWGRVPIFWGMPLLLAASMLVMAYERFDAASGEGSRSLCWIGIAMFFVQQVPFAMHWPLLHEFVNHRISSRARTTVLSIMSLGSRATYACINILLFRLQHLEGIAVAMLVTGCCGFVVTTLVMWMRPPGLLRGQRPID